MTAAPGNGGAAAGASAPRRLSLDRLDVAILRALQRDGRASFRRVARSVDASVTTVSTRVRRLRRLGILTGFVPLVDAQRLQDAGRSLCCLFCHIRPVSSRPAGVARLAARVSAHPDVCYVFEVASRNELIALASTPSVEAGRELVQELARLPGVASLEAAPILRVHKERPRHPISAARWPPADPAAGKVLAAVS